jgi:hypothetical protein
VLSHLYQRALSLCIAGSCSCIKFVPLSNGTQHANSEGVQALDHKVSGLGIYELLLRTKTSIDFEQN